MVNLKPACANTNEKAKSLHPDIQQEDHWSPLRTTLHRALVSFPGEVTVAVIIGVNVIFLIIEADAEAAGDDVPPLLHALSSDVMPIIFTLEVAARLYVFRCTFFTKPHFLINWNTLDMMVVFFDWCVIFFEAVAGDSFVLSPTQLRILRAMKSVRMVRAIRTVRMFRELYVMLDGFMASMKALFWALILILLVITMCSILAVTILHPLNVEIEQSGYYQDIGCERCGRAFESVWTSNLTFIQQVVAGDSWGLISLPMMERYPATIPLVLAILITIALGLLNLILAVIVENAQRMHAEDIEFLNSEKRMQGEQLKADLSRLCEQIDKDQDGKISRDELVSAWDEDQEFAEKLTNMGVDRWQLQNLFTTLDIDGSGSLAYEEVFEFLFRVNFEGAAMTSMLVATNLSHLMARVEDMADKQETLSKIVVEQKATTLNLLQAVGVGRPLELSPKAAGVEELQAADEHGSKNYVSFEARGVLPDNIQLLDRTFSKELQERIDNDLRQVIRNLEQYWGDVSMNFPQSTCEKQMPSTGTDEFVASKHQEFATQPMSSIILTLKLEPKLRWLGQQVETDLDTRSRRDMTNDSFQPEQYRPPTAAEVSRV